MDESGPQAGAPEDDGGQDGEDEGQGAHGGLRDAENLEPTD
jgi:hypothetical protein